MTYFDTAYIVKCYVKEAGWRQVRSSLAARSALLARFTEGSSCMRRCTGRHEREALTERQLEVVLRQFRADEDARLRIWLPLTAAIMTEVATTFARLPRHVLLRTGDAVHLLTARQNGLKEVFSNDQRLLTAAPEVGIPGRNVIRAE